MYIYTVKYISYQCYIQRKYYRGQVYNGLTSSPWKTNENTLLCIYVSIIVYNIYICVCMCVYEYTYIYCNIQSTVQSTY